MKRERSTSLFLPAFTGMLLLVIILSGITELACLASHISKSSQQSKLTNKTHTLSADRNPQKMISSVAVAEILSR